MGGVRVRGRSWWLVVVAGRRGWPSWLAVVAGRRGCSSWLAVVAGLGGWSWSRHNQPSSTTRTADRPPPTPPTSSARRTLRLTIRFMFLLLRKHLPSFRFSASAMEFSILAVVWVTFRGRRVGRASLWVLQRVGLIS